MSSIHPTIHSTIHYLINERKLMDRRAQQVQPSKHHLIRDRSTPVPKTKASAPRVTAAERLLMIADNAYYRAEHRGFAAGHELADWLAAEAEVDAQLAGSWQSRLESAL